jgi:antitoxin HigA-1
MKKQKQSPITRKLPKLRKVLFWDTQMESIDWKKQYKSVILRVFERGNDFEKSEIIAYYGSERVNEVLEAG